MITKHFRLQALILCLIVFCAIPFLQGCGGGVKTPEEYLSNMKEFSTPDKTASIYLNQEWSEEDLQMDWRWQQKGGQGCGSHAVSQNGCQSTG